MNDLEMAELDLAVARAEGEDTPHLRRSTRECVVGAHERPYFPTTNRDHAMRLLEKYKLIVGFQPENPMSPDEPWYCDQPRPHGTSTTLGVGSTPAIAICRAVVALAPKEKL